MGSMTYTRDRQIGRIIKGFAGYAGETQRDLARILEVEESSLSRAMNGNRRWTADELARIADHFGVGVGVLFEDPETRPDPRSLGVTQSRWNPSDTAEHVPRDMPDAA